MVMKQFIIRLAKGIAIAVLCALTVSYFWCNATFHGIFWGCVALIAIAASYFYLKEGDEVYYKEKDGILKKRKMTKLEQLRVLVEGAFKIGFVITTLWLIGYLACSMCHISPKYWETFILYGLVYSSASVLFVVGLFICASSIADFLTRTEKRRIALKLIGECLAWLVVIICSFAVFVAILYYFIYLN